MKLNSCVVFMKQDDNLFPFLTTRETLMFSARLRLPGSMKHTEKAQRVSALIEQLGLVACADTHVGNEKVATLTLCLYLSLSAVGCPLVGVLDRFLEIRNSLTRFLIVFKCANIWVCDLKIRLGCCIGFNRADVT